MTDRQVDRLAVLHGFEHHVAFELIEELIARIEVIILASVRAANDHYDEIAVAEKTLIAYGRLQKVTVVGYPAL